MMLCIAKKKQKTRQQQHEAHVVTIETFTRDEIVEKKGSLYIYINEYIYVKPWMELYNHILMMAYSTNLTRSHIAHNS